MFKVNLAHYSKPQKLAQDAFYFLFILAVPIFHGF